MSTNNKKITAAAINKDRIESEAADLRNAAENLKEAARAYFVDLDTRKTALAKQVADYQDVFDDALEQRRALAATIADLTSRGQIDEAASEYEKLEAMDKEIAKISRKLRLVQNAEVKGDPKLYQAAKAAQDAVHTERSKYIETIRDFNNTVQVEKKRLEDLERELKYTRPECVGLASDDEFTKVDRHYKNLDRKEQEAKEKEKAAREAAEREARITYL